MVSSDVEQAEIAAEQAYVDTVHERLEASAQVARSLVTEGMSRGTVGNEGALVERDAMVFQATRRLTALNAAHDGLVFGRLTMIDGDSRYIGRIGVRDADREILLIDWRAPAASLFYRATAQDPVGVVRRRVLRCRGTQVIGVEDDLLDADHAPEGLAVIGEGALLASLSRARDETMHSVVATIQKEQDEAIRAPIRGVTTIGGGPGTGKTVVALHRAAFLLYSDRRRFESGGVLVLGPSGVFMDYIERVLPSLGETSVTLRSVGALVDGVRSGHHDEPVAATAKGSARMIKLMSRAATSGPPGAPTRFRYFYNDDVLELDAAALERLRRQLLSGGTRNRVYSRVPSAVASALWSQASGERALEKGEEAFADRLGSDDRFVDFVEQWWPIVDAVEVWRQLPQVLERFGGGFSVEEKAALVASWASGEVSIEDVPLIDELRYLIGEAPTDDDDRDDDPKQLMSFERREREDRDGRQRSSTSIDDDGYAHVLVDEAQDLSPMQWRMVGRRGRWASWTIVGDPAQSSWPYPAEAAAARAAALEGKPEHVFRLSTNYRNSAEIYDLAARVAHHAIPGADLADAVRRTGAEPEHHVVAAEQVAATVAGEVDAMLGDVDGSIAVVVPRSHRRSVVEALADVDDRVRVLDGLDTKGLEFDAVLVVEPDAIVAESEAGWRTLYVVLTRATQRLATIGTTDRWRQALEPVT